MDQKVLEVQQWLNKTYGDDSRFKKVKENGQTGWPIINALIRATQIELGIQSTADNFGNTSKAKFKEKYPNGIKSKSLMIQEEIIYILSFKVHYGVKDMLQITIIDHFPKKK